MKTFNEAIIIFKTNINKGLDQYNKNHTLINHEEMVTQEVFFKKLSPWDTWGGLRNEDQTDFQRTGQFLDTMTKAIREERLSSTEELITFAINFPDKGSMLSFCILKSIREASGFTDIHSNYLLPIYRQANSWEDTSENPFGETVFPNELKSKRAIENLIGLTVIGTYKRELLGYLHDNLGLKSTRHNDYGQRLLQHLDQKILEKAYNKLKNIQNLYEKIDNMRVYGEILLNIDREKAEIAIELSKQLKEKAVNFFSTKPDKNSAEIFQMEFNKLLHSKNKIMQKHRAIWKLIIINILIALTIIPFIPLIGTFGLVMMGITCSIPNDKCSIHSFFYTKTNRQQQVEEVGEKIEDAVQALVEYTSLC